MEIAMEKIMSLRQECTIRKYCDEFQVLFELVKNSEEMSEYYTIYLFMDGLEPTIRDIFQTWHQYSFHTLKDNISLALKLDANKLSDTLSPYDPKSSLYIKDLVFDFRKSMNEIMERNEVSNEDKGFDGIVHKVFDEMPENFSGFSGETEAQIMDKSKNENDIQGNLNEAPKLFHEKIPENMDDSFNTFDVNIHVQESYNLCKTDSSLQVRGMEGVFDILEKLSSKIKREPDKDSNGFTYTKDTYGNQLLLDLNELELLDATSYARMSVHKVVQWSPWLVYLHRVEHTSQFRIRVEQIDKNKVWDVGDNGVLKKRLYWMDTGWEWIGSSGMLGKKNRGVKKVSYNHFGISGPKDYGQCLGKPINVLVWCTFGSCLKAQVLQFITTYDQVAMWIAKPLVEQVFGRHESGKQWQQWRDVINNKVEVYYMEKGLNNFMLNCEKEQFMGSYFICGLLRTKVFEGEKLSISIRGGNVVWHVMVTIDVCYGTWVSQYGDNSTKDFHLFIVKHEVEQGFGGQAFSFVFDTFD